MSIREDPEEKKKEGERKRNRMGRKTSFYLAAPVMPRPPVGTVFCRPELF